MGKSIILHLFQSKDKLGRSFTDDSFRLSQVGRQIMDISID